MTYRFAYQEEVGPFNIYVLDGKQPVLLQVAEDQLIDPLLKIAQTSRIVENFLSVWHGVVRGNLIADDLPIIHRTAQNQQLELMRAWLV